MMKGREKHRHRLKRMAGPELVKAATKVVYVGADMIRAEAFRSISAGSVSGKNHKPSAPGSPPNRDSGTLQAHIETIKSEPLKAEVRSEAPYAKIQEFGGTFEHPGGTPYFMRDGKPVFVSNKGQGAFHNLPRTKPHSITLPARPYMRPARDKKRKDINKLFASEIDKLVKRSGR